MASQLQRRYSSTPSKPPPSRETPVSTKPDSTPVEAADVALERDIFLRSLLRELSGTLEEVVGLEEARGFVSVVGRRMGDEIGNAYRTALDTDRLDRSTVADVLVDLKRRIEGDFYIIEASNEKIVLGNRRCPFGEKVVGRPSLCMMTSNVFGTIAAENLGYGKVELQETIAEGAEGCRVVVYLESTAEAEAAPGREYYGPPLEPK